MGDTLRDRLLTELEGLQRGSNPFVPQRLSGGAKFRSTQERGASYRRYGQLFARVQQADPDDPLIEEIADEVLPGWRRAEQSASDDPGGRPQDLSTE
ncbi:hypothetical protein OG225_12760 [Nocardia sp. NBC_01377]|uniref:hypothetical protein n=1 Tax=Nocardia TaxID=1817 RepID=UPI001C23675D|nr:hypothetical protein [Nocardia noduli]